MTDAGVEAPVVLQQAGANADGFAVGAVGPVGTGQFGVAVVAWEVGEHVDRRAEGGGAVGRRADAALHLHGVEARRQVGHVDPVYSVALGIVDGHTVDSHIDARAVGAAHAHRGVAHSRARVAGGHHRGGHLQKVGHVAAVVFAAYLCLADVGECHGRLGRGAVGDYLH